jgi:hypothetical protein
MRLALLVLAACSLVACSETTTGPTTIDPPPLPGHLAVRSSRPRQPAGYASTLEALTASTDFPIPASGELRWSATSGVFLGSGPVVTLIAPPVARSVTMRVWASGPGTLVSSEATLKVHDELREIGGMSRLFLERFSRYTTTPETVVSDFQAGCGANGTGKQDELDQTRRNRKNYQIQPGWVVGLPSVEVKFDGVSPFRSRRADAWAAVYVAWTSRCLVKDDALGCPYVGFVGQVTGVDWVTARYDKPTDRWWLCDSDFDGVSTTFTSRSGAPLAPWRK